MDIPRFMLTDIDDSDIHCERLTGEVGHVAHIVADIAYSHNPMENSTPYTYPGHELWVDGGVMEIDNIEDCVIK